MNQVLDPHDYFEGGGGQTGSGLEWSVALYFYQFLIQKLEMGETKPAFETYLG